MKYPNPTARITCLAVTMLLLSLSISYASLPVENHYKTYECTGATVAKPIELFDQFGPTHVTSLTLDKFATPVMKDEYPIIDPEAHQMWWGLFAPQPARSVLVTDQFGTAIWTVGDAVYLLTPAKKYPQPGDTPPDRNHYLCYRAIGPNPNRFVVLTDQFGTQTVFVAECKLLCNPVRKTVDGVTYPIVDPTAHLACYFVDNPVIFGIVVPTLDQFGNWQIVLDRNDCLCNPALKEDVVGTQQSTWGRIKALYQ